MSLKNKGLAEKAFEDLSNSISDTDRIMIETRLFMYRFLSEIDRITSERGINRKELAALAGTSPSYMTQLFQGKKIINLQMLTRIKKALNIDFKVEVVYPGEKAKEDCPEMYFTNMAATTDKQHIRRAVHGTLLSGKLSEAKSVKAERRPEKTF